MTNTLVNSSEPPLLQPPAKDLIPSPRESILGLKKTNHAGNPSSFLKQSTNGACCC